MPALATTIGADENAGENVTVAVATFDALADTRTDPRWIRRPAGWMSRVPPSYSPPSALNGPGVYGAPANQRPIHVSPERPNDPYETMLSLAVTPPRTSSPPPT